MKQTFIQQQKQQQNLIVTQTMQQSLNILKMNGEELLDYLQEKTLENPLLEVSVKDRETSYESASKKKTLDHPYESNNYLENISNKAVSLFEHIKNQLLFHSDISKEETSYILLLVEHIDEKGYLTISLEEIASTFGLDSHLLEHALNILQKMDPAGIGARDVRENLIIQTKRDLHALPLTDILLENDFESFAYQEWDMLSKKYSLTVENLEKIRKYVQSLSPYPGLHFSTEPAQYIQPDIIVKKQDNHLSVEVVGTGIPNMKFQKDYYREMAKIKDLEAKKFLNNCLKEYKAIKKSVVQRQSTMERVALAIVKHQHNFFFSKERPLIPLTLKVIAEELQLHESTISRTVRGKYIKTDFGLFLLKDFFPIGLKQKNKSEDSFSNEKFISSHNVKQQIKKIIHKESSTRPISDQNIVAILKKEGIDISRRTVAKYRIEMGIVSSNKRKIRR